MPTTAKRREWWPKAIANFRQQTHPYKRLLIASEDGDALESIEQADDVQVLVCPPMRLGPKRNWMCERCAPGFILHWDDDDWSHPERMAEQAAMLLTIPVTGYSSILFDTLHGWKAYQYRSEQHALGSSLAYRRDWWQSHPFDRNAHVQEDHSFAAQAARFQAIRTVPGLHRMVARDHGANTSGRNGYSTSSWSEWTGAIPQEYSR